MKTAAAQDLSTIPSGPERALERIADALHAMGAGDPAPYTALWADDPDVTLFGAWGPIERGHDAVTTTFRWVASRFSDGTLEPRYDVVGVSGDLAYTVGFEARRSTGRRRRTVRHAHPRHPCPPPPRRRLAARPPARRLPAGRSAPALTPGQPTTDTPTSETSTTCTPNLLSRTGGSPSPRSPAPPSSSTTSSSTARPPRWCSAPCSSPRSAGGRHRRRHRDLRGRLSRPPARLRALRAPRRPARSQSHVDRHAGC